MGVSDSFKRGRSAEPPAEPREALIDAVARNDVPANDGADSNVTLVFHDEQGATLTREELRSARGTVTWEIRGVGNVPSEAERLHQEGRAAGAREDYDAALALLTSAAELAPTWPYPVYDRAFTHLLRHDFGAALADYQKTMELAPRGFFTAALSVDMLTREAAGEFPKGLYAAFVTLEHMLPEQQRGILARLVEKFPSFAAAWNAYASFEPDPHRRLQLIENGLVVGGDPDTRGELLVGKALAIAALGRVDEAVGLLRQIAADPSASLNVQAMAEVALTQVPAASTE